MSSLQGAYALVRGGQAQAVENANCELQCPLGISGQNAQLIKSCYVQKVLQRKIEPPPYGDQ